eukprot:1257405-Amphidinium_carterae.2
MSQWIRVKEFILERAQAAQFAPALRRNAAWALQIVGGRGFGASKPANPIQKCARTPSPRCFVSPGSPPIAVRLCNGKATARWFVTCHHLKRGSEACKGLQTERR